MADWFARVQTQRMKDHNALSVNQSPGTRPPGPRLTFRSLVTAQTTATPTATCMIPFSDVGGSTTDQELPTRPQKKVRAPRQPARLRQGAPRLAGQDVSPPTFGIVPADSFPDQRLPLPEGDPQEVVGPTADLDRLPWGFHEGPR